MSSLPIPNPSAQHHSQALTTLICAKIAQQGPLSFADYMQLALYEPCYGYYSSSTPKFGEAGDFITAPEISSLFGQCIAQQIQQLLLALPGADILEFGAGSGQLAIDILTTLHAANLLPEHYYILELSAELRRRQQKNIAEKIPGLAKRVIWLEQLPNSITGVVIANEVLDAMPVERFCYQDGKFWQYQVTCQQGLLTEKTIVAEKELSQALTELTIDFPDNYHSEINLLVLPWLKSLGQVLKQGLVLLIDYGFPRREYYHEDRSMGTLMCHYQHRAHADPYFYPGLQDITAHVDFTAVAEAAIVAAFQVAGYTTQANFLLSCGLTKMISDLDQFGAELYNTNQAVKRLLLPSEMGELFKVMALTKNFDVPLVGFSLRDMREKL